MADNKYAALVERLRDGTGLPVLQALMTEAADAIEALAADRRCAVNELCLRCGSYKQRHLGACDGCRWKSGVWDD